MNIRVLVAIIGVALVLVSGALLGLGHRGVAVQFCFAFGFAVGFIAIGCEHFFRESPILSRYRSRRASVVVGCVFITIGVGLLALVAGNLMARGFH
jgi:hypothetical protein